MSDEDKVTETLALLADTLEDLGKAVVMLAERVAAIEEELADSCYLEGCGNPAGQHGLCEEHMPKAALQ
jgi:hypothetical protein